MGWKASLVAGMGLIFLIGCVTPQMREDFARQIKQWYGHTEADLVTQLGIPTKQYEFANGQRILNYRLRGYFDGMAWHHCEVNFRVDEKGRIVYVDWNGDLCYSNPPGGGGAGNLDAESED